MLAQDEQHSDTASLGAESSRSRHSSIQGPYRNAEKDVTFPIYRTIDIPYLTSDTYARSLLSAGNGIGLNNVIGNESRPEFHMKNGALLGDVGYINHHGYFSFAFNIFFPANHPIHKYGVPTTFSPALPELSAADSTIIPNHFPPGTVISSPGIKIIQVSDSPVVQFDASAVEGAVLVLPTGGTREDLNDPSRIYPYLKTHAASWYQLHNGDSDRTVAGRLRPNGTLCVVIGVDRAESWAMATFPPRQEDIRNHRRFGYNTKKADAPWEDNDGSIFYRAQRLQNGNQGPIFLRVISLGLSSGEWSRNVAYVPPDCFQYYATLSTQAVGLGARLRRSLPSFITRPSKYSEDDAPECIFHPSIVLLNILTLTDPSAVVALVPDSVWISQLSGRHLSHSEVVRLVRTIIDNFDIKTTDGTVTFVPKDGEIKEKMALTSLITRKLLNSAQWILPWVKISRDKAVQVRALENMAKILSI